MAGGGGASGGGGVWTYGKVKEAKDTVDEKVKAGRKATSEL